MRAVSFSLLVCAALAATLPAAARAQSIDDSCRAVQAMSAVQRVNALGSAGASYKPVLDEINRTLNQGASDIRAAEKNYADAVLPRAQALKRDNPAMTDEQAWNEAYRRTRDAVAANADAKADAALAAELIAQYKAHEGEKQIIIKAAAIPRPDNDRLTAAAAVGFVRDRGLSDGAYDLAQKSPTFRHLLGTLRASEIAAKAPGEVQSAPLAAALARAATAPAGIGFENAPDYDKLSPDDKLVARAAAHAASLVAEASAEGQRAELILDHLPDYIGDAKTRSVLTNSPTSATAREASAEVGKAVGGVVIRSEILERLNHLDLSDVQKRQDVAPAIAKKVEDTIKVIYHHVTGTAPPSDQP
jgi:hypothetical protein